MTSFKKLLAVCLIAIFVSAAMTLKGHDFLGPVIGLALMTFGFKKHFSRCDTCQSWKTHTEFIEEFQGGPGRIRRCSKCGNATVIDGSVIFAGKGTAQKNNRKISGNEG